jgi:phosphoglycerol transferase MdoB-like AlkP superfamily enzyme
MFGVAARTNVIIIQAESLQAFAMGLQVEGQLVTPNLSKFAEESLHFEHFYEQTHGGATSDSVFSSLQSLYPIKDGPVTTRYPANGYRGLPALLAPYGYTSLGAMGASGRYWNIGPVLSSIGIQRFYSDDYYAGELFDQGVSDEEFFTQTVPLLTRQKEPFMAFLMTTSNHHPYDIPEKHRKLRLNPPFAQTLLGKYLQSVNYFDIHFGRFVEDLRESGLLDRSVVVVFGDHRGWLGTPLPGGEFIGASDLSTLDSWRMTKRVPLLIRTPGAVHTGIRSTTGGTVDISPTILSLLGITDDDSVMLGTDLSRGQSSLVVFRDGSFTDGHYFYIADPELTIMPRCYDASGVDVDCATLQERRNQAIRRLEASDIIVSGNLARMSFK